MYLTIYSVVQVIILYFKLLTFHSYIIETDVTSQTLHVYCWKTRDYPLEACYPI